jgi:hypothetical protein
MESLCIQGKPAQVHATASARPPVLCLWQNEKSRDLWLDRFDVRGLLTKYSDLARAAPVTNSPTPSSASTSFLASGALGNGDNAEAEAEAEGEGEGEDCVSGDDYIDLMYERYRDMFEENKDEAEAEAEAEGAMEIEIAEETPNAESGEDWIEAFEVA